MVSAGLIIKSEKGNYYDKFRNRIIFPVFGLYGKSHRFWRKSTR